MHPPRTRLSTLDPATAQLVHLAASIAAGSEGELRAAVASAVASSLDPVWVEEVILQSYLFAGFPRALNAAREWRKASRREGPSDDPGKTTGRRRVGPVAVKQPARSCTATPTSGYARTFGISIRRSMLG